MNESGIKASWPSWVIGGLVAAAGLTVFVVVLVTSLIRIPQEMIRFKVPTGDRGEAPIEKKIELTEAGTYTIFHECKSDFEGSHHDGPPGRGLSGWVRLRREDGGEVPVYRKVDAQLNYLRGGNLGYAAMEFKITRPGTHLFSSGGQEAVIAIGHDYRGKCARMVLVPGGVCAGTWVLAAGFFIVAIVRTVRNGRLRRAA
jgi:hypothetical protein